MIIFPRKFHQLLHWGHLPMINRKAAIKRELNQAYLDTAEREQSRDINRKSSK